MFKSLLLKGRTLCLLLCCMISSLVVTAQTKHTGKVIGSDDKQPVVGASVRIKGTNLGAVTDANGEFSLTLSPGNVLVVSYLTYQTREVAVQGDQYLTITLTPTTTSLNEVVVTGYQTCQIPIPPWGDLSCSRFQDICRLSKLTRWAMRSMRN
ncbi:MAG: TonB-dependent Receptor Plug Domain protein, partial [Mucilaginibacter sp.]|nr:TonB-dependent Receptor Plug Domain protein [Mucilaginibacter sp.]